MAFNFTIAVAPSLISLDRDLQYIKSAILYADKVTLISPMAYLYTQLSDGRNQLNERNALRILNLIFPFCRMANPKLYDNSLPVINELSKIIKSKKYQAVPMVKKLDIRRMLQGFAVDVEACIESEIGSVQCNELKVFDIHK